MFQPYATFSPQDDKIRIYFPGKPDDETLAKLRELGFGYAPMQGHNYAVWTPAREDLALELCGEIGEEETTREERAEDRSERFEGYSTNAGNRAASARERVDEIANGRPFGQPILIGHHSERRARKDQEKIENGMRTVINELDKLEYWQHRAAASVRHANYLEAAPVVLRRIKKLQADLRKHQKELKETTLRRNHPDYVAREMRKYYYYHNLTEEQVAQLSDDELLALAILRLDNTIRHHERWISHLTNRIAYEQVIYEASGGVPAERQQDELEVGGAIFSWVGGKRPTEIIRVTRRNGAVTSVSVKDPDYGWKRSVPLDKIRKFLTKAQYEAYQKGEYDPFAEAAEPKNYTPPVKDTQADATRQEMTEALKTLENSSPVFVPDFFPTPRGVGERMANMVPHPNGFAPRILEPEAGNGLLAGVVASVLGLSNNQIDVCEINATARNILKGFGYNLVGTDFLQYNPGPIYDAIVMNPPFSIDQDIAHFLHAYDLLKQGGRVISILSRTSLQIRNDGQYMEPDNTRRGKFTTWFVEHDGYSTFLPPDTFKESGANVHTLIAVVIKE